MNKKFKVLGIIIIILLIFMFWPKKYNGNITRVDSTGYEYVYRAHVCYGLVTDKLVGGNSKFGWDPFNVVSCFGFAY